jgi:hypothetical protein
MVHTLNERSQYTQNVLYSWEANKKMRCLSISQFKSYRWDKDYIDRFDKSFRKIYKDLYMRPFCDEK